MIPKNYSYNEFPILEVLLEKSFENKHLIATVAYQISRYHWAAKTVGGINGHLSDEQLLEAVFKYGMPVDPELAIATFQIKELEFRKFEWLEEE
jgi:hypothetical protein